MELLDLPSYTNLNIITGAHDVDSLFLTLMRSSVLYVSGAFVESLILSRL